MADTEVIRIGSPLTNKSAGKMNRTSIESGTYQDPLDISITLSPSSTRSKPVLTGSDLGSAEHSADSAVHAWLGFLQMERYTKDFLDNGYDDLETVKKIGLEDLDAIGVESLSHKAFILDAVRVLREQGATWVYLLQAKGAAAAAHAHAQEQQMRAQEAEYDSCGERLSAGDAGSGSSGIASGNSSSIPWQENDGASSSASEDKSAVQHAHPLAHAQTQARAARRRGGGTTTRAEMTPESVRAATCARAGTHALGRPGRGMVCSEGEDLIQRVSDLRMEATSSSSSPSSSPHGSLRIQLRERLANERIQLSAPPFTSKVGGMPKDTYS